MPKTLNKRKQRCREWMARPSPVASPNSSDNEDNEDELFGDGVVAAAEQMGLKDASEPEAEEDMEQMC